MKERIAYCCLGCRSYVQERRGKQPPFCPRCNGKAFVGTMEFVVITKEDLPQKSREHPGQQKLFEATKGLF